MEILFKKISDIKGVELTLSQLGILFAILMYKDKDPKVTLAVLNVNYPVKNCKDDLVALQEKGLIKWSGYKRASKSKDKKELSPDIIEAVSFMNALYGRKFDINSKSTTKNLLARLKQYGLEKVKLVIANRWEMWKDDKYMSKYLKPSTIFRSSKFDMYLEEVLSTGKGRKFLNADSINLVDKDVIDKENVKTFSDEEVYETRVYDLSESGTRLGIGIVKKFYGKDLKMLIKAQERRVEKSRPRELEYLYLEK